MAIDTTKPNTSQTIGDVISSTKTNFVEAQTALDAKAASNTVTALQSEVTAHTGNTTTAHGINTLSASVTNTASEIQAARGGKTSLNDRLSISLQSDGGLKLTALNNKWIDNSDTPTYVSSTSFTVAGDRTKVYLPGSILRGTQSTGYVYGIVASSSYSSVTTVTLAGSYAVLAASLSKVEMALLAFANALETGLSQAQTDIVSLQSQVSAFMISDIAIKTVADSPYTAAGTDRVILCDCTGGNITLNLPALAGALKRQLTVVKTDSTANIVTVDASGTELMNGSLTKQLTAQWDCLILTATATGWLIATATASTADTVDGFHAAQTPAANTVVVADGSGKADGWITARQDGRQYALTPAGTINLDWGNGSTQYVTLNQNTTLTFAGGIQGQVYRLLLNQDATGSRSITWPASIKWMGGTAPALTITANKSDIITLLFADNTYYAACAGNF